MIENFSTFKLQLFSGHLFNDQFLKLASWSVIYRAGQIISDQFLKFESWSVIYWSDIYWSVIYWSDNYWPVIYWSDNNWSAIYRVSQISAGQLFNWSDI